MNDLCTNCGTENLRDYPVCVNCETKCHFTHRDDCRCVRIECTAHREVAKRNARFLVNAAVTIHAAISSNKRRDPELEAAAWRTVGFFKSELARVKPDSWCEPCFTDECKHVVSTL